MATMTRDTHTVIIPTSPARIKVLGLGGAGCNTIKRLSALHISGVELIAANTDQQSLNANPVPHKILLGSALTRGLGSGGKTETGQAAAEESYRELLSCMQDCDLFFLTAGMGGGTGSGAIQIAARMARSLDMPTIAIVTIPFAFEAGRRQWNAQEAIASLRPYTDTLIAIPNDRLFQVAAPETTLEEAFALSDDILIKGIQGVAELLGKPGLLDVDFSHVLRVLRCGGGTSISMGIGCGQSRALKAIQSALSHPMLADIPISQAKGLIVKFSGNLSITELEEAMRELQNQVAVDTEIIAAVNPEVRPDGEVLVTLLAGGVGATAVEYTNLELARTQNTPQERLQDPYVESLPLEFPPLSFNAAEATMDDLEVPAFLRRGMQQVMQSGARYG